MVATQGSLTLSYRTAGTVTLTGDDLSIYRGCGPHRARRGARVEVSHEVLKRLRRARDVVDRVLERGDLVYGMNTGVGSLSRYRIPWWAWSSSTYAFSRAICGVPVRRATCRTRSPIRCVLQTHGACYDGRPPRQHFAPD